MKYNFYHKDDRETPLDSLELTEKQFEEKSRELMRKYGEGQVLAFVVCEEFAVMPRLKASNPYAEHISRELGEINFGPMSFSCDLIRDSSCSWGSYSDEYILREKDSDLDFYSEQVHCRLEEDGFVDSGEKSDFLGWLSSTSDRLGEYEAIINRSRTIIQDLIEFIEGANG